MTELGTERRTAREHVHAPPTRWECGRLAGVLLHAFDPTPGSARSRSGMSPTSFGSARRTSDLSPTDAASKHQEQDQGHRDRDKQDLLPGGSPCPPSAASGQGRLGQRFRRVPLPVRSQPPVVILGPVAHPERAYTSSGMPGGPNSSPSEGGSEFLSLKGRTRIPLPQGEDPNSSPSGEVAEGVARSRRGSKRERCSAPAATPSASLRSAPPPDGEECSAPLPQGEESSASD